MEFKSKVDASLATVLWGSVAICFFPIFIEDGLFIGLAVGIPMAVFIALLWVNTKYYIRDEQVVIKGIFKDTLIPIVSITSVRPTRNPLSAPALSMDRLEINYGKYEFALISPLEKERFMEELLKINPHITIGKSLHNE
jgi:hypothetical protein